MCKNDPGTRCITRSDPWPTHCSSSRISTRLPSPTTAPPPGTQPLGAGRWHNIEMEQSRKERLPYSHWVRRDDRIKPSESSSEDNNNRSTRTRNFPSSSASRHGRPEKQRKSRSSRTRSEEACLIKELHRRRSQLALPPWKRKQNHPE
jgi:hypothetical protein